MTATPTAIEAVSGSNNADTLKPEVIECFNPATYEKLGEVPVTSPEAVTQAVARARNAQQAWAKSSFKQRRQVLDDIKQYVIDHADELCELIVKDSGKTLENAMMGEILPICTKINWLQKNGEKYLKSESVSSGMFMHKKARIDYVPLGVAACIIPWNYPLQNIISSLVAPLMAGNAVILKPSEAVAWSSVAFQKITDRALEKAGFSKDTVQIINGFGDTGAALVRSGVDIILFIGSVENGRRIIQGSAEQLTPVIMELGGKDPMIICEDADMDKAVHSALGGCFVNLGQNCIASERIIVADSIHDEFVQRVTEIAKSMRQGHSLEPGSMDVGAITTPQQLKVIDGLVKKALQEGARALTGGAIVNQGHGIFYPPTVLVDVTPDMTIAQTEVFGPVMLVMRAGSEAEAISIANSTNFGLHSSVMTKDRKKGERIAKQLQAGATCVNDFGLCYLNQGLPFGGVKYSGYGRMNGRDGLRAYTNHKAVLQDRWPIEIPPKLYPVKPEDYATAKEFIKLLFSSGFSAKAKSLLQLIKKNLFSKSAN